MQSKHSRRDFLITSSRAAAGVALAGSLFQSCANSQSSGELDNTGFVTGFSQTPLAYGYDALDKAIDAETMEIHYSKHAASYAKALNEAAGEENVDTTRPLEDALRAISKYSTKLRNNGGGHYNHELFWKSLSPLGGNLGTDLSVANAIDNQFGSLEAFKKEFEEAGKSRFGSGWAWLYVDGDKQLKIGSTPNQDNPLMDVSDIKGTPLLGLDVWEHAYYLRYQNKRPDYIAAWWNVVNWENVQNRFAALVS